MFHYSRKPQKTILWSIKTENMSNNGKFSALNFHKFVNTEKFVLTNRFDMCYSKHINRIMV